MPTTPIYALRYPLPTDPADVPVDLQELATDVEAALGGPPVTSLPGAPVNGQIIRYRVATDGPVWTLQYLATSAGPYRWHFAGGASLHAHAPNSEGYGSTAYGELAQLCRLTVPLAGEYDVNVSGSVINSATNQTCIISYSVGATAPSDSDAAFSVCVTNLGNVYCEAARRKTIAAASELKCQVKVTAGAGTFAHRHLQITPARLG